MTYREAVDAIEAVGTESIKNTTEETRRLLHALGDPDRRIPLIHVAGTNGKGSVCAYLESVLRAGGRTCGLFTSPHLRRINERFRIGGEEIGDEEFAGLYERVRNVIDREVRAGAPAPSYFELLFLMACTWFSERKADAAILECGMGGLHDATNAIDRPVLSVITSISLDHMKYLGQTIPEIAAQKAGIMRRGVPCVCDGSDGEALPVFRQSAEEAGSPLYPVLPADYKIESLRKGEIDFSTSFRYDGHTAFSVRANAPYQVSNAALALMALKVLRETDPSRFGDLTADTVRTGILSMRWPARMEEILPGVYLDGAHNPDGIRRFLEAAGCILQGKRGVLLFSAVNDKDYSEMIRELAQGLDWSCIFVTEIEGSRKSDAGSLVELFHRAGRPDAVAVADFRDAFREARRRQGRDRLFICGSLYLAGETEEIIHDQL